MSVIRKHNFKPQLCREIGWKSLTNGRTVSSQHIFEEKYDGIRAFIVGGRLYSRAGNEITDKFPEFKHINKFESTNIIYDGEIVAQSEKFEDIIGRAHLKDKFQIKLVSKKQPAKFMCFDRIKLNDDDVKNNFLIKRKNQLTQFNNSMGFLLNWFHVVGFVGAENLPKLIKMVEEKDGEGIIAKKIDGGYTHKRSFHWIKYKRFIEGSLKCTSYEVTPKGVLLHGEEININSFQRSNIATELSTVKGDIKVNVNGISSKHATRTIDEIGHVTIDVQFMLTQEGNVRFPSFRGFV